MEKLDEIKKELSNKKIIKKLIRARENPDFEDCDKIYNILSNVNIDILPSFSDFETLPFKTALLRSKKFFYEVDKLAPLNYNLSDLVKTNPKVINLENKKIKNEKKLFEKLLLKNKILGNKNISTCNMAKMVATEVSRDFGEEKYSFDLKAEKLPELLTERVYLHLQKQKKQDPFLYTYQKGLEANIIKMARNLRLDSSIVKLFTKEMDFDFICDNENYLKNEGLTVENIKKRLVDEKLDGFLKEKYYLSPSIFASKFEDYLNSNTFFSLNDYKSILIDSFNFSLSNAYEELGLNYNEVDTATSFAKNFYKKLEKITKEEKTR